MLLPAVLVAAFVLAYFTFRTTLQIDTLRQQSVLEATLALANEKADRLDKQIIDQDNVVVAVADPAQLDGARPSAGCPPRSARRRRVRAILVLDDSRTRARVRVARDRRAGARKKVSAACSSSACSATWSSARSRPTSSATSTASTRGQSYLVSYWQRVHEGRRYLVVAWHDIGRIVRETLPTLYAEPALRTRRPPRSSAASRVNVVDEEGRIIYGPPLRTRRVHRRRALPDDALQLARAGLAARERGARVARAEPAPARDRDGEPLVHRHRRRRDRDRARRREGAPHLAR